MNQQDCATIISSSRLISSHLVSSHLISPLTARVVGAPQKILQPVSSIFLCSQLPSGTWPTPGLCIPCPFACCLSTSSSVCLIFFPLSLYLARWFWSDLVKGRHDHTTAVCVSLRCPGRSSCGPIACWILALTSSLVTWSLSVLLIYLLTYSIITYLLKKKLTADI